MTKAKTNALEALRALIAERQQYEQWVSILQSKRDSTPAHVFERVQADYNARLQRVLGDIKGHAEELQLSISALSSRLVEVARDEDTRRDALQEAELRATVGEYEPEQWEQLRTEAESGLEKIAADRAGLDSQLTELRSIQKLSEVGSIGNVTDVAVAPVTAPADGDGQSATSAVQVAGAPPSASGDVIPARSPVEDERESAAPGQAHLPLDQAAPPHQPETAVEPLALAPEPSNGSPLSPAPAMNAQAGHGPSGETAAATGTVPPGYSPPQRARTGKTPPFGSQAARPKPPESRVDQSKTLKCPECGAPNYPTEWYCEKCGGELATM